MPTDLTEFCVYTIVKGDDLRQDFKQQKARSLREGKQWVTAHRLWREAEAAGRRMPIVFGDADHTRELLYWGLLTEVRVSSAGTRYRVDRLRPIDGSRTTQELVLRSSGKRIARSFIRPYAICETPSFVSTASPRSTVGSQGRAAASERRPSTTPDYLSAIQKDGRRDIAKLAASVIERASALGPGRWGATPYDEGIRINVGWTEILTAWSDHVCLVVAGDRFSPAALPRSVRTTRGAGGGAFYPSVPGSIRVEVPYGPRASFRTTIRALDAALSEAIRLAGRRRAGRGVKAGHRQGVVEAIEALTGRPLPQPDLDRDEKQPLIAIEGALVRIVASKYERKAAVRRACVQYFGLRCSVCDLRFDERYGELGRDFIHVHHLVSVASKGRAHRVDPRRDLRPVCPNCHAMLHREEPLLSIQDLRRRLLPASKP